MTVFAMLLTSLCKDEGYLLQTD